MNTRKGKTRGGGIKRLAGWLLLRLSLGGCTDSTGSVDIAGGCTRFQWKWCEFSKEQRIFAPSNETKWNSIDIRDYYILSRSLESYDDDNNNNNNKNKNARLHIAKREFFLEEKRRDGLYLCGWIHGCPRSRRRFESHFPRKVATGLPPPPWKPTPCRVNM